MWKARKTAAVAGMLGLAIVGHAAADTPEEIRRHTDRMAREHAADAPIPNPLSEAPPSREVESREVVYASTSGREVTGYVSRPADVEGSLPAVLVIHEWWGLNDNIRAMTRRLAAEGFMAFAVDLYGGRSADTPEQARALMEGVNEDPEAARVNLRQAYDWLREHGAPSVASLGWCFGGGWSLQTALMLEERIDGAVIYYGFVETAPELLSSLEAPVLAFFGGQDQGIPVDRVTAFEMALEQLGKEAEVIVYPDAGHAFANPSGRNWQPGAADDAWKRTIVFLHEVLHPE